MTYVYLFQWAPHIITVNILHWAGNWDTITHTDWVQSVYDLFVLSSNAFWMIVSNCKFDTIFLILNIH